SGDVPRKILREQPAFEVGRAAGARADQKREALSLVEVLRVRRRRAQHDDSATCGNGGAQWENRNLPGSFCLAPARIAAPAANAQRGCVRRAVAPGAEWTDRHGKPLAPQAKA